MLMLESCEVGFHLPIQPGFLLLAHGWKSCDDDLGVFEFDQVMKLDAFLLIAGVVAIEDCIAGGLDFVGVSDLFWVWCGRGGFVINDLALLHQIENTDQSG